MVPSQFGGDGHLFALFPGALGDFLCFTRALPELRRRSSKVTVVARSEWTRLLDPNLFRTASIDDPAVAEIFGATTLERAVRLFAGATEIHSFTGAGDPGFCARLKTLAPRVHVHAFRSFLPAEHAIEYYARCLGVRPASPPIAIETEDRLWALAISAGSETLVVHAGSGSHRKNWNGFEDLTRMWADQGGRVLEIRGPAEDRLPPLASAHVVVQEQLPRIAALLGSASLYVGNDSGITHLAAAMGARGVALFGSGGVDHWQPRSDRIRTLEATTTCTQCDGLCRHVLAVERVYSCLRTITSDSSDSRRSTDR